MKERRECVRDRKGKCLSCSLEGNDPKGLLITAERARQGRYPVCKINHARLIGLSQGHWP